MNYPLPHDKLTPTHMHKGTTLNVPVVHMPAKTRQQSVWILGELLKVVMASSTCFFPSSSTTTPQQSYAACHSDEYDSSFVVSHDYLPEMSLRLSNCLRASSWHTSLSLFLRMYSARQKQTIKALSPHTQIW